MPPYIYSTYVCMYKAISTPHLTWSYTVKKWPLWLLPPELYIHYTTPHICTHAYTCILYSGKVWWGESLANLVNHPWFAKLKPSKLVLTINNLLADLLIFQTFFRQILKESIRQTFPLYGNKKWSVGMTYMTGFEKPGSLHAQL